MTRAVEILCPRCLREVMPVRGRCPDCRRPLKTPTTEPPHRPLEEERWHNEQQKTNEQIGGDGSDVRSALPHVRSARSAAKLEVVRSATEAPSQFRKRLAALNKNEAVCLSILAAAARVGELRPQVGVVECLLPHHGSCAQVVRDRLGQIRYSCACDPSEGRLYVGVVDVFASCVAGRVLRLSRQELPRWHARALAEIGSLRLQPVALPSLPADAPAPARGAWAGVASFLAVEAVVGDAAAAPFPFTVYWAQTWCSLPQRSAARGIAWLRERGYLVVVGEKPVPGRPKPMPLYRVGGAA